MKHDPKLALEERLDAYRVFERQARRNARQALFFLGLVYRTTRKSVTEAVAAYAPHAFDQVRHLLAGARAPIILESQIESMRKSASEKPADPELAETLEALEAVDTPRQLWIEASDKLPKDFAEPLEPSAHGKAGAGDGADPERDPFRIARDTRLLLGRFLEATRPTSGWNLFQFRILALLAVLRKNLSLAVGLALVYFVLFRVEAVHSLWVNEGWWAILIAVAVAAPYAVTQGRRMWLHRRCVREGCEEVGQPQTEEIPWWDVAGRPFRSARPIAVEPPSTLRRWPSASGRPRVSGSGGLWGTVRTLLSHGLFEIAMRDRTILSVLTAGQAKRMVVYLGLWLVVVGLSIVGLDDTRATVFVVFSLCYWILVLAHLIDFWEFLDPFPARLMTLAALGTLIAARLLGAPLGLFIVVFLAATVGYLVWFLRDRGRPFRLVLAILMLVASWACWRVAVTDQRTRWREAAADRVPGDGPAPIERLAPAEWPAGDDGPVVVMTASGGGSRSALFTGMTLTCLWAEHAEIAAGLQAISSVSGGSLANAAYLARAVEGGPMLPELLGEPAGDDPCRPRSAIETSKLLEAPYLAALSGDFLRPTLRGLLVPTLGRGEAIEHRWRGSSGKESKRGATLRAFDRLDAIGEWISELRGRSRPTVDLGDLTLGSLADAWRRSSAAGPPFPLPLFNSTTLDGHRMVLSPLAAEAYTRADQRAEALDPSDNSYVTAYSDNCKRRPTRVFYRDAIYGLEDVLPSYDPLLASVVRASANFPFGFPLVKVEPASDRFRHLEPPEVFEAARPWYLEPLDWLRGPELVQLTDGGALSNSGMWTLHNLLLPDPPTAVRDCAAWSGRAAEGEADESGSVAPSPESSGAPSEAVDEPLHCELLRRGVLLIVVEASKMPTYPQIKRSDLALAGAIKDQSPIGQYLHRTMFDLLEASYPGRIAIEQIDLVPTEEGNVLTTWALSEATREALRDSFLAQWPEFSRRVDAAWEALATRTPPENDWGARPPVD